MFTSKMLTDRQTDRPTDGQTDGQTDRQTDGHANLIVGLVTRNPPKNSMFLLHETAHGQTIWLKYPYKLADCHNMVMASQPLQLLLFLSILYYLS